MAKLLVSVGDLGPWEWDQDAIDLKTAFTIKAASGLGLKAFSQGVEDYEPAALQAWIWWLRRTNGEPELNIAEVNFFVSELEIEPVPDPTEGATTPSADSETTS